MGPCRWGTTAKLKALERYCNGAVEYVGIAHDEPKRLEKERKGNKIFPLDEWKMTESDCLYYYSKGSFDMKTIFDCTKYSKGYLVGAPKYPPSN